MFEKAKIEKPAYPEVPPEGREEPAKAAAEKIPQSEKIEQPVEIKKEPARKEKPSRRFLARTKKVKPTPVFERSETFQQIEDILSRDMEEVYQNLSDNLKDRFRKKGEETASKIEKIISGAREINKVIRQILNLIRQWLFIIPGINRMFLEQEAKIKTNQISELAKSKKRQKIS